MQHSLASDLNLKWLVQRILLTDLDRYRVVLGWERNGLRVRRCVETANCNEAT